MPASSSLGDHGWSSDSQADCQRTWCPPKRKLLSYKDTGSVASWLLSHKEKAARLARPRGTFATHSVSQRNLLWWLRRLHGRSRGLGARPGRPGSTGGLGGPGRRRRRDARLRVIHVHHRLGHIDRLAPPYHRALRPGLGGIDDHVVAVVGGELDQHRSQLLKNALRDFVLLILRVLAGILQLAVETFLLGLDLLHEIGAGVLVQLVALRVQLFLEAFDFVVLTLQLILLRFQFLAEGFKIAPAFISGEDRLLHADGANLGSGPRGCRRGGCGGSRGRRPDWPRHCPFEPRHPPRLRKPWPEEYA